MAALAPASAPARLAVGKKPFTGQSVSRVSAAPLRRRTARPLAQTVSARAATKTAYICVDCGYIYQGEEGPFEKLPNGYRCPICSAPKRRFKPYAGASGRNDAKSMNKRYQEMQRGGGAAASSEGTNAGLLVGLAAGAVVLAGLYVALSTYYS